jgi:hypothetical protein
MSKRYLGGVITKSPTIPNVSSANGIWTMEQQAHYRYSNCWPRSPEAPTIGAVTVTGGTTANVAFTAPSCVGSNSITSYTATSNTGVSSSNTSSPIVVSGLSTGTGYTFSVRATNSAGIGKASGASSGIRTWSVPGAPTIGTATAVTYCSATVAFTAPVCNGGTSITGYTATSCPGGKTGTGASSPITVGGLSGSTAYTFKVKATNAIGTGPCSSSSNSITTPNAAGSQSYTSPGTYSWVAPSGVTSVSAVVVGAGGGAGGCGGYAAGGGALAYTNNISVSPGSSYSVVVGAGGTGTTTACGHSGGLSSFNGTSVKVNVPINPSGPGGTVANGTGGSGGGVFRNANGGGGGAGGYNGTGGTGGGYYGGYHAPTAGAGGAGGGGYWGPANSYGAQGGGGVGIFGQGSNGGACGGAGSGGSNGGSNSGYSGGVGGSYGGGGGAGSYFSCCCRPYISGQGGNGASGAVRILWPGTSRTFPSTCVGSP